MQTVGQGDTWGISNSLFITLFVTAAVALVVLALVLRLRVGRGGAVPRTLGPVETAYVAGGPGMAVLAALAELRVGGAVAGVGQGFVRAVDVPNTAREPLSEALLTAVRQRGSARVRHLPSEYHVRQTLEGVRTTLQRDGFLITEAERMWVRLAALPLGVLIGVGIARIIVDAQNGEPIGFLPVLLPVVAFAALVLFFAGLPRVTRAGGDALRSARAEHAYLDPSKNPAWSVYGPHGAALGVALFGLPALLSIDPTFAEQAELGRYSRSQTDGGYAGGYACAAAGSGGCGGGSGCGGGGCGGGGGGSGGGSGGGCGGGGGGCGGGG
ncbi:TIGR04222 domain-containing membrane protein [Actinomadura alba]|uniref:TIGR04222 domain-containing membrane protein n=1 Tax=Actinomadura alba TaxID=406431 RepID=A0ABR7LKM0_9ACTN|nr:TIGR04222 domain-containing membrane protein [Actinomadura alba]MBC6465406.1 TIGR04222 domain-containing membrane protein [Actinomadura alba]